MSRQIVSCLALVVASFLPGSAMAQATQATLSGRVTEADGGRPVESAQVFIVGTTIGQLTSADGRYVFRNLAPGTVQVRVMRVPYQAQTRTVTLAAGQETTLDVALERAVAQLEQVVSTATGEQRRVEIGNVIGQIDASTVVETSPIANMGDLLVGKVAGVQVLQGNSTGTGSRVRIRGTSSLSLSNEPIYIIDGIRMESSVNASSISVGGSLPSRVNDLNPEEIESVEIVKGPSAATLYGTDAANGVIVIKTKRGRAGAPRWNAYVEQGLVTDLNEYPTAFTTYGTRTTTGADISSCFNFRIASGFCTPDSTLTYNLFEDDQASPLGTGHRQQYGLQVSGGTEAVTYFVSGEYEGETGVLELPPFEQRRLAAAGVSVRDEWDRPNALSRGSGRANVDVRFNEKFGARVSTAYTSSEQRLQQTDNNTTGLLSSAYGGTGRKLDVSPTTGDSLYGYRIYTPGDIFQETVRQNIDRFIGSVSPDWRPNGWLSFRGNFGADFTSRVDSDLCRFENCSDFGDQRLGFATNNRTTYTQYTVDVGGTASFQPRTWLATRTTVGVQYFQNLFARNGADGEQLPPGATSVTDAAIRDADEATAETRTLGAFVEQALTFHDRLFTTFGLRADDNSAFGADFSTVLYPKFSVSWVISDEPFFPSTAWLGQLRLRGAVGASGVQPGTTDALQFYTGSTARVDDVELPGVSFSDIGNADLKPERSTEFEAGFDLGLLDDRLGLELTYYFKDSRDALIERIVAGSAGPLAEERFENLGQVVNRGFEFLVNSRLVDRPSFAWDLTVSGSTNTNELKDLGGVPPIIGATIRQIEGYPLNGYWAPPIESFSDLDGDGFIEYVEGCEATNSCEIVVGEEHAFLGYSQPRHEIAISNGISFLDQRLRLSALVDYKGGHKLYNNTERIRCQSRNNCAGLMDRNASFEEQARVVALREHPSATLAGFIEDASFWRLREVALTANAPDRWAALFRGSSLSATLAARNLAVWTDYTGIDPESNYGQNDVPSDFQTAPPPSYVTLRVNVGF